MGFKNFVKNLALVAVIAFASVYLVFQVPSAVGWGPLNNYQNYSVRTTVNITESYPEILNIACNDDAAVTLSAGTTQKVVCIVMIRDYNGADTINGSSNATVNGTFYFVLNKSSELDDNNTHYSNLSCSQNTSEYGTGNYYINWSCAFDVWYYASNGSWIANVTIVDRHNELNLTTTSANTSSINTLYAINVTDVIDFGQMYVGETTAPGSSIQANVTNFGNMAINFTVYGYGGEDPVAWAASAMNCSIARNISINSERYGIDGATVWADMTPISGASALVPNITLAKQTDPALMIMNATYWGLYINTSDNPLGICQGTVIFSAISAV